MQRHKQAILPLILMTSTLLFGSAHEINRHHRHWHSPISSPIKRICRGLTFFTSYLAKQYKNAWTKDYKQERFVFFNTQSLESPTELAQHFHIAIKKNKRINASQFILGASTSEHQCSQQCTKDNCSWMRWATTEGKNLPLPGDTEFGKIDLWNNYESYIDYAQQELGLTALRFSVEWGLVEPKQGDFKQEVLDHYAAQFVHCIKRNITPVVCLHHYTDPIWFIDQDGFEKTENIQYFARYCSTVYRAMMRALDRAMQEQQINDESFANLMQHPPLFATFNSPEGYAFKGYLRMEAPPANTDKKGLSFVARVLGNMMKAHVAAYKAINKENKEIAHQYFTLKKPQIGFLKNITQVDPAHQTLKDQLLRPVTRLTCSIGEMLQNECIYQFFTTGTFRMWPFGEDIKDADAPQSLDFIGLNYYSNQHIGADGKQVLESEDIQTDNPNYSVYPEGMYRAVCEISKRLAQPVGKKKRLKSIPMYVTENGIATQDNQRRNDFYQKYLYALAKAIDAGHDVRGYLTWTLADNYEWPKPHSKRRAIDKKDRRYYGLCTVSEDGKSLVKKVGAQFYTDFVKEFTKLT